jgi:hypothetical protein
MKGSKTVFWVSTGFIFLFEGIMPALTGHSELAKQGITHLGYPEYFVTILVLCKVAGATVLIIPWIPYRIKEWAYAGLSIELLCAAASTWIVDGFGLMVFFPIFIFTILVASYVSYHVLNIIPGTEMK